MNKEVIRTAQSLFVLSILMLASSCAAPTIDRQEPAAQSPNLKVHEKEESLSSKESESTILPVPAEVETDSTEVPEIPVRPEISQSLPSGSFLQQFGSCSNQVGPVSRIMIKLRPISYYTSLGLSAAEGAARRQASVDRFPSFSMTQIRFISSIETFAFQISIFEDQQSIASSLFSSGDYEFVRRDCVRSPVLVPNDAQYANQTYLPVVGAPAAWDLTTGSSGVTIAILDTGIDVSLAEFTGKITPGLNTITCSATAAPGCGTTTHVITADPCGNHGTQVGAVAAANGNDALGVAGISFGSLIMPVRVTNAADCTTPSSELAQGIVWASENGARVINVSYSGVYDPTIQDAAEQARRNGSITIFSAGNNTQDLYSLCVADFGAAICDQVTIPDVLVVGATTNVDAIAAFSNFGNLVDMVAPGQGIRTVGIGGVYSDVNGTSFSAPIVSGAAALLLSLRPSLSPQDLQHYLLQSSLDLGAAGKDATFGVGRLQIDEALDLAVMGSSSSNYTSQRGLDFMIPRGPVKVGIADQQVRGGADSRMMILTQGNSGLLSLQRSDLTNRDLTMSTLPESLSLGRGSLFYRKTDTSADFVFTDQNRTRVYLGSMNGFGALGTEPAVVHSKSCGPFQDISAIHLTESATDQTLHLLVADRTANTVYSFTLDPTATNLCTQVYSASITSPLWIRSVSGANPRIYIGYKDSLGLKMRAYQDSDLTPTSAAQTLATSGTAQFGSPIIDTTNDELWVPIVAANDSTADDYVLRFNYAAYPPNPIPAYETCQSPTQIAQDYEGGARYLYILCPASKQIQILDSTYAAVGTLQLNFSPRKMLVGSDGTNRFIALMRSDPRLTLYKTPVANPPAWTTTTISLPAVMDDLGAFASLDHAVLVSLNSNLLSVVDLSAMSLSYTNTLPSAIDALAVQSAYTSHFVSSAANSAYSLEELFGGAWKLRQYSVGTFPNQIRYRQSRLYVTNRDSNNLSVINLATAGVSNIATQTRPTQLEINSTLNRAWVGNETTQSLSTINITIGAEALLSHTALGFAPRKIKYQSSDNTLYLSGPTQLRALDGTTLVAQNSQTIAAGVSDISLMSGGIWASSRSGISASAMTRAAFTTTTLTSSPNFLSSNQSTAVVGLDNVPSIQTSAGDSWSVSAFSSMFSTLTNLFMTNLGTRTLRIFPYSQMGTTTFSGLSMPISLDVDRWDADATGNLWIANANQLKLQRIDASTQMNYLANQILNRPIDLAFNSSDNRVYFLMRNANAVFTYDTINSRLSAYSTCQAPSKIHFDSAGLRLWIMCSELNSLAVISLDVLGDPASQIYLATGLRPIDWSFNATTNSLYLANLKSDNVYAFNTSSPATAPSVITVGRDPRALAVNATTNLIEVFHETLRTQTTINGVGNTTATASIDGWGFSKAATNSSTASVYAISPSPPLVHYAGTGLSFSPTGTALTGVTSTPTDLGVSVSQDKTYISYFDANTVKIYDEGGATVRDVAVGDEPRNLLVVDGASRVYVANYEDDSVSVISTTTNAVLTTVSLTAGCGPTQMEVVSLLGQTYIYAICNKTDSAERFHATTYVVATPISLRLL